MSGQRCISWDTDSDEEVNCRVRLVARDVGLSSGQDAEVKGDGGFSCRSPYVFYEHETI